GLAKGLSRTAGNSDARVPAGHLTASEVTQVLQIVHDDGAIIVGGQAINIWAEHYAGRDTALDALGPLTSKDIDFYRNNKAARRLAEELNGELHVPTLEDTHRKFGIDLVR